jgi:hypothetical protein
MSPNVIPQNRTDLTARRTALLAELGITREELAERACGYRLSDEERSALDEIEDIEFLLGAEE